MACAHRLSGRKTNKARIGDRPTNLATSSPHLRLTLRGLFIRRQDSTMTDLIDNKSGTECKQDKRLPLLIKGATNALNTTTAMIPRLCDIKRIEAWAALSKAFDPRSDLLYSKLYLH
jgi:hypothetical protein